MRTSRATVATAASMLLLASAALAGPPPKVLIDPGHGGDQDGADGPGKLLEKRVCLEISLKVVEALKARGVAPQLTRQSDVGVELADRVALANRQRPELFVSIHANSMATSRLKRRTEGIETYFLSASASGDDAKKTAARENAEVPQLARGGGGDTLSFILADLQRSEAHGDSSRAAYAVHERLITATRAVDRGVQQAPFYVLMGVDAPAILVEVGFISHPGEGKRLGEAAYQQQLATAIAEGVVAFLEQVGKRDSQARVLRP